MIWDRLKRGSKKPDRRMMELIEKVDREGLSYLGREALSELALAVAEVERHDVPGVLIETGCALGGSGIVITAAKNAARDLYIYDVFGMIPPPSEKDGQDIHARYQEIVEGKSEGLGGKEYYGYQANLLDTVTKSFRDFGWEAEANHVHFVKGLYEDTLVVDSPVAFAHIDCDWYESVMTCLERIEPRLSRRGVLVIDDYYAWSGCTKAVDEYFAGRKDEFLFAKKSRLHITRK